MYQGTTPTIPIKFKGVDLTQAKIFLTIQDDRKKSQMTFTSGDDFSVEFDGTDTVGTIRLTQEQTLRMSPGNCEVQARFIFPDGSSGATGKTNIFVNPVLLKGVISYG
jgi:hypothetical protein